MQTILIIEDHPMMVDAIKASVQGLPFKTKIVAISALAELASPARQQALQSPHLIVADLNLPDSKGLATLTRLRTIFPLVPILIFSQLDDPIMQSDVMTLGAAGFLSKSHQPKVFIERLRTMVQSLQTQSPVPQLGMQDADQTSTHESSPIDALTTQQRKVLKLLTLGLSSEEVAAQLEVAEPTVRTHLTEIYRRLEVKNRSQAIVRYLRWASQHDD